MFKKIIDVIVNGINFKNQLRYDVDMVMQTVRALVTSNNECVTILERQQKVIDQLYASQKQVIDRLNAEQENYLNFHKDEAANKLN